MEFKGNIRAGHLEAEFRSDANNQDPDLLIMTYSSIGGGSTDSDRDETAPGGRAATELDVSENGVLHVMVATGHESDVGQLTVRTNGEVRSDERVQGAVHWVYSVAS